MNFINNKSLGIVAFLMLLSNSVKNRGLCLKLALVDTELNNWKALYLGGYIQQGTN